MKRLDAFEVPPATFKQTVRFLALWAGGVLLLSSCGGGGGGGGSTTTTPPSNATVPGTPASAAAELGANGTTVVVTVGATADGGSTITGYTATSTPSGLTGTSTGSTITVNCPTTCAGYAFSAYATNAVGNGTATAAADVINHYNITETFLEPETQPRNSIFIGSFDYDSTTSTISNLKGLLSESMTDTNGAPIDADHMVWLTLGNQLVSWHDASLGGTFAATFLNTNMNTFFNTTSGATDFWSPQVGVDNGGLYYGFPTAANNPGNAYALIFVPDNPATSLTAAQIAKLAYADCVPTAPGGMLAGGGMMGAVCMTGTSHLGYTNAGNPDADGTMSGYPITQVITKQ